MLGIMFEKYKNSWVRFGLSKWLTPTHLSMEVTPGEEVARGNEM